VVDWLQDGNKPLAMYLFGMGRYHGVHGFRELSHARSVFTAAPRGEAPR